jgi:hypothetical protein
MLSQVSLQQALQALDAALVPLRRSGLLARAPFEERQFPALEGGRLVLHVPHGWREEFEFDGAGCTLVLRPRSRRPALMRLAMKALTPLESSEFSIEGMRRDVEQSARDAGAAAIHVFAGAFGGGFYFRALQGARLAGQFLARPVVIDFSLAGAERHRALEMVRSARALMDALYPPPEVDTRRRV